ncbi:MAG TPA: SurA N-terminal domain-containing protein [Nocardioides sp.]|nr:SurA N-terminal domain-containing protein [Nocardioides sp.]
MNSDPGAAADTTGAEESAARMTAHPEPDHAVGQRLVHASARFWQAFRRLDLRWRAGMVVLLVGAVGAGVWWQAQRDDLPAGAAFRVGDRVVTATAVQQRIDALKALYGVKVPTDPAKHDSFVRDAAKSMAVQIILQDEAARTGIGVTDEEVRATVGRLIAQRYPDGGRTAFVAALGQMGASEAEVGDEIRNQILVSHLFDSVVKNISVSGAELRTAFLDRRAQLGTPPKRDVRNIVVADRRTAERVRTSALGGVPFGSLAARYSLDESTSSHGGELGAVSASQLESSYAAAAFSAPVGSVFGPVRNKYGWNVGLVVRAIRARPAVFAKVRASLEQTLTTEKSVAAWRAWLGSAITSAHVDYADAYRPADPDAVPDVNDPAAGGAGQ